MDYADDFRMNMITCATTHIDSIVFVRIFQDRHQDFEPQDQDQYCEPQDQSVEPQE